MRDERVLHPLNYDGDLSHVRLNNPFEYQPHPAVLLAARSVVEEAMRCDALREELERGKMLGVLVVRSREGEEGYLAAFSGSIAGVTRVEGFVPPIYNLDCEGGYFREGEARISALGERIKGAESAEEYLKLKGDYEALCREGEEEIAKAKQIYSESRASRATQPRTPQSDRESQYQKAQIKRVSAAARSREEAKRGEIEAREREVERLRTERAELSNALQRRMFESYRVVNGRGEWRSMLSIFEEHCHRLPPAGAGECAAPKLLHYALTNGYTPLSIGEFWCGASPRGELREAGQFYGACRGKCHPILGFVLQGLDVETAQQREGTEPIHIIYEDDALVVVNKPAGMLSVKGRVDTPSVEEWVGERYSDGVVVHRLDQDTSGLLVVAKSGAIHRQMQRQFIARRVEKGYVAVVEGIIAKEEGVIELAMRGDIDDRPRQMVDRERGKSATTHYRVISRSADDNTTRLALSPHTGRTHQLRLHCAHREGLAAPIVGDRLYGRGVDSAPRMMLHAERIAFTHPTTGERVELRCEATF